MWNGCERVSLQGTMTDFTWRIVLLDDHSLTHHSDAILTSKRILNPFLGIRVVKPDFINPETVFIPSGG